LPGRQGIPSSLRQRLYGSLPRSLRPSTQIAPATRRLRLRRGSYHSHKLNNSANVTLFLSLFLGHFANHGQMEFLVTVGLNHQNQPDDESSEEKRQVEQ